MKINGYDFKIGADPEFFVKKFGKLVSAHGLVPGSKENPFLVPKGAVQVDGMALEFNIDPAEDYDAFEDNMSSVLDSITAMVPGYEIFVEPVADFGADYIQAQPDEAKELGCSPDFSAYTGQANPRPNADVPFRTASGHVHIGWTEGADINDEGHLEACRALTKSLDVWLGIPSLVWDQDERRRSLYGAAGAFRPKPYGMEYRVLSNKWITDPVLRMTVYHNTIEAIRKTFDNPDYGDMKFLDMTAKDIIEKKEGWANAWPTAFEWEGVKTSSFYRRKMAEDAKVAASAPKKKSYGGWYDNQEQLQQPIGLQPMREDFARAVARPVAPMARPDENPF